MIAVKDLKKSFKVPQKTESSGLWGRCRSLFYREWDEKQILKGLNFEVRKGEFVGYIGANGAGKSTTIKALTGILCADSGEIRCAGFDPYRDRYHYTYHIGVVFGQKSILEYEVPVAASFELYKRIYELDEGFYRERLGFFNEILGIDQFTHVPVRKLSFGQRMRCEVAASLLHKPDIVFLDEPTIGLDASAKKEIRKFLKTVNEVDQTTVILTTHDMKDIESLCQRVMLIDAGQLIYDGDLELLKNSFLKEKSVSFQLQEVRDSHRFDELKAMAVSVKQQGEQMVWVISEDRLSVSDFIRDLLNCASFVSFGLQEPELEEVVDHLYAHPESVDGLQLPKREEGEVSASGSRLEL